MSDFEIKSDTKQEALIHCFVRLLWEGVYPWEGDMTVPEVLGCLEVAKAHWLREVRRAAGSAPDDGGKE